MLARPVSYEFCCEVIFEQSFDVGHLLQSICVPMLYDKCDFLAQNFLSVVILLSGSIFLKCSHSFPIALYLVQSTTMPSVVLHTVSVLETFYSIVSLDKDK
jgi:hypothetical protein